MQQIKMRQAGFLCYKKQTEALAGNDFDRSQLLIIRTDIFIMTIFHAKSFWDSP